MKTIWIKPCLSSSQSGMLRMKWLNLVKHDKETDMLGSLMI